MNGHGHPSRRALVALIAWCATMTAPAFGQSVTLAVGTKSDTEARILGAMLAQVARSAGATVTVQAFGGTQIAWQALVSGEIDVYPEYTGTLTHQILAERRLMADDQLAAALTEQGLAMSRPLGFNNTYAIAMTAATASRLGVSTISDLAAHPQLRLGFSNEFMGRADGWFGLKARYALPFTPAGYEHALLYGALTSGALDAIEVYSTDPQIAALDLRVLLDDRAYLPRYDAVILYRQQAATRVPAVFDALRRLEGRIDETTMIGLNAQVRTGGMTPEAAAAAFLDRTLGLAAGVTADPTSIWTAARQHIYLVAASLAAAIVVAVPLGLVAARQATLGHVILGTVGVLQTIPALALLVFMIPLLGLGSLPTMGALFLYSLLPIVRNTSTGLRDIAPGLRESALALGLPALVRLWQIELPLASRTILAGIKTAAVINVGTATIGGLIGAGGFGQAIVTGLALNDRAMILWQGAVPAAALALLVQGIFEVAERVVVPAGLRLPPSRD
jgi:osmoprotectant transport system permease protein